MKITIDAEDLEPGDVVSIHTHGGGRAALRVVSAETAGISEIRVHGEYVAGGEDVFVTDRLHRYEEHQS